MRAFAFAHFHQRRQRLFQRLFHGRPDFLRVRQFLVALKNARRAQNLVQRHRPEIFSSFASRFSSR